MIPATRACGALRERAAGLAALPEGDPERQRAERHAAACPACARALAEADALLALLDLAPAPPAPSADAIARAAASLRAEVAGERARRVSLGALVALLAASVVAALTAGAAAGPLAALTGLHCLWIELAMASLPAIALAVALRRGALPALTRTPGTSALALGAVAAAGALGGQAALALGCPVAGVTHAMTFHAGGVFVIAALAALAGRLAVVGKIGVPRR